VSAHRGDRLLLALYPRTWRDRYADELTDLVAQLRADGVRPGRVQVDVARAAGSERLRAAELFGDAPARSRARGGLLLVLWAWTLFVLAGCVVAKFAEHWQQVPAEHGRLAADAFHTLVVGAMTSAALVALALAVTAPRLWQELRTGLWRRLRRRVALAATLSAAELFATIGLVRWADHLTDRQRDGHDLAYGSAVLVWAVLGTVCLAAWVAVATAAARRIELPAGVLRILRLLGGGVAMSIPVVAAATLTWWIALTGSPPGSRQGQFGPAVAAMLVAAGLGALGVRRTFSASLVD
jgi:hypothetical protein